MTYVMSDLDFWRSYTNTTWMWHLRLMVIMHWLCIIEYVHRGHISCIWLTHPYLWTKVKTMSMSSTLDTSLTWKEFISTTLDLLFDLPLLQIMWSLFMEDLTDDNKQHLIYGNIFTPLLLLIFHNNCVTPLQIFHLNNFQACTL